MAMIDSAYERKESHRSITIFAQKCRNLQNELVKGVHDNFFTKYLASKSKSVSIIDNNI